MMVTAHFLLDDAASRSTARSADESWDILAAATLVASTAGSLGDALPSLRLRRALLGAGPRDDLPANSEQ